MPIFPVMIHGLGKALPKGEALLAPFFCDIFIGKAQYWTGDRSSFMKQLEHSMEELVKEGHFKAWE